MEDADRIADRAALSIRKESVSLVSSPWVTAKNAPLIPPTPSPARVATSATISPRAVASPVSRPSATADCATLPNHATNATAAMPLTTEHASPVTAPPAIVCYARGIVPLTAPSVSKVSR